MTTFVVAEPKSKLKSNFSWFSIEDLVNITRVRRNIKNVLNEEANYIPEIKVILLPSVTEHTHNS